MSSRFAKFSKFSKSFFLAAKDLANLPIKLQWEKIGLVPVFYHQKNT